MGLPAVIARKVQPTSLASGWQGKTVTIDFVVECVCSYAELPRGKGLIAVEGMRGRYETYRVTSLGAEKAARLRRDEVPAQVCAKIDELKQLATSMPFLDLLEYVYEKHPLYAGKSKLRR